MTRSDFVPRRAAQAIADALADTRVVLVNGARQAGKSTLVRAVAGQQAAEWRDLDLPQDRQSALEDPIGFVAFPGLMVIDEIQRAPELLLAIKAKVDADPSPGQFLLTGSSRLLGLRELPDTLPGRMETIELWPFSQGEIDDAPDSFIDAALRLGPRSGTSRRSPGPIMPTGWCAAACPKLWHAPTPAAGAGSSRRMCRT